MKFTNLFLVYLFVGLMLLGGCAKDQIKQDTQVVTAKPEYARKLGDGEKALVKLDANQWPDLSPLQIKPLFSHYPCCCNGHPFGCCPCPSCQCHGRPPAHGHLGPGLLRLQPKPPHSHRHCGCCGHLCGRYMCP